MNEGNAILIVGILYLYLLHGLEVIPTFLLVLLGAFTWAYHAWGKERERLLKAKIRLLEAKAKYYEAKEKEHQT